MQKKPEVLRFGLSFNIPTGYIMTYLRRSVKMVEVKRMSFPVHRGNKGAGKRLSASLGP